VTRVQSAFAGLVVAHVAHATEEYAGRLWETFPPARFVTGLISPDRERNFLIVNAVFVAFGLWCLWGPLRRGLKSGLTIAWIWVVLQLTNCTGHLIWSLRQGGYTPGLATVPVLLVLALNLGHRLTQETAREALAGN
jgi:hypothetical protein